MGWNTICDEYGEEDIQTHPVVNVYCGGALKATYGVDPQLSNFYEKDDSWKVTEIKWVGTPSSDKCEITPNLILNKGSLPESYEDW